jgi:hypothetical protein
MSKEAEQTDQTGQEFGREGNEVDARYKPLDAGPKIDTDREA